MPNNDRSAPGPHSGGTFFLTTLGGCGLACSSGGPPILGSGKPIALLVYLDCSPGWSASREHLLDLLWTDLEPFAARHALRQAVWYLRQRLGDDAILTAEGTLQLGVVLDSDRGAFLDAVDRVDLESAVERYTGEFLPRFAVPGGAEFERWAELERYRLRLVFLRTAEVVVRRMLASGRARGAMDLATRARNADPHRESVWRLLVEVLHSAGDGLRAQVEGDALEQMLAREGREPELPTRRLLERVRRPEAISEDERVDQEFAAELVGREREFGTIVQVWEAARVGRGIPHLHIEGESGLGKTRLLSDAHARLRALGARVLRVRATPAGRDVAYALASEIARGMAPLAGSAAVSPAASATLVGLNPSLSSRYAVPPDPSVGNEALRRRSIALTEMMAAVAEEGPLAVLVDDLHWADEESRTVLLEMVDKAAGSPVLFLTAARPGPESRQFGGEDGSLSLAPLSTLDVGALVGSIGALPASAPWTTDFAARLRESTGGSPLLVIETLQLLLERGILQLEDRLWGCAAEERLWAELEVGGALTRRVERLPAPLHGLLMTLAAAGAPIPQTALELLGDTPKNVRADLMSLEARGLARRSGASWGPGHDEVAEAVWSKASEEAKRAADADLGRILAASARDDPEWSWRAGRHLARGGAWRELEGLFPQLVAQARARGDRRTPAVLASELVGDRTEPDAARRLLRALPIMERTPVFVRRRVAAIGIVLAAAGAAAVAIAVRTEPIRAPPDAELLLFARDSGGPVVRSVPVRLSDWDPEVRLDAVAVGEIVLRPDGTCDPIDVARRPDGDEWLLTCRFPGGDGEDLVLVDAEGSTRRLTAAPGDDRQATWAPDGRRIAFVTERWGGRTSRDVALLDPETGEVTPFARGEGVLWTPRWSPDGTRVAYHPTGHNLAGEQVCWRALAVDQRRCIAPAGYSVVRLVAWSDPNHLLVALQRDGTVVVATLALETGMLTALGLPATERVHDVTASPDGRWIALRAMRGPGTALRWFVAPRQRPDLLREVVAGETDAAGLHITWGPALDHGLQIERLTIGAVGAKLPTTASHQLRVSGVRRGGDTVPMPEVAWLTADSAVGMVDDFGIVHPRAEGEMVVHARIGDLHDSIAVVVGAPTARLILSERWGTDFSERWRTFGPAEPMRTTGPNGHVALGRHWGRGAGGAYTRTSFVGTDGMGIDARVTRSARTHGEHLRLTIVGVTDQTALEAWDHGTGRVWSHGALASNRGCGFSFPAPPHADSLSFVPGGRVEVSDGLAAWSTIRVQVFADGTCGLAIDGRPVTRARGSIRLEEPLKVVLETLTVEAGLLFGSLDIWEGVRGDIDWRALEHSGVGPDVTKIPY